MTAPIPHAAGARRGVARLRCSGRVVGRAADGTAMAGFLAGLL